MDKTEVKHSDSFNKILTRYLKNYITDDQLSRYLSLSQITEDEFETIKSTKKI